MDRRAPLVLLALTLLAGPLLWLAFGRESSATAQPVAKTRPVAKTPPHSNCDERTLAYGLSDDPQAGRAYESEALFGAHPPLPRAGYYAPGRTPASGVILHALSHKWVVVKYRPGVDARALATTGEHVLVISGGERMPFALGAVAWGAQLTCATPDLRAAGAFARRYAATASS